MLTSFDGPFDAVVAGASGGLGQAFAGHLLACSSVRHVWLLSRRAPAVEASNSTWLPIDLEDESSIAQAAEHVQRNGSNLRVAISALGILHDGSNLQPEKTWRSISAENMHRNFAVNTIGPTLLAKHLIPLMPRDGKAVFAALSARVGSTSDNRIGGWYSYRASKAALNMVIKSLAIEWARKVPDAVCIGLHPGTVSTGLSAPFVGGTSAEKLFEPGYAAERLLQVVDERTSAESGRCFAWDGSEVEP